MPGRVLSGYALPGSQVMSVEERPVPAARRNTLRVSGLQNGKSISDLIDKEDGKSETRDLNNSSYDDGLDMMSYYGSGERQHYPVTNYMTSYKSPGQTSKPVSTVRPQSAMAFASFSSLNYGKASIPERPPTSLGVSRGQYHMGSGINTRPYVDSDFPVQHRSPNYGNGVTLSAGYSETGYMGQKSEEVYAAVARQHDKSKNTDVIPGYITSQTYERKQQYQVSGKHPFTPVFAHKPQESKPISGQVQGRDNPAFVQEEQSKIPGDFIPRPASTSLDLRSAWQRLYGNSPDLASSRRPSVDALISTRKTPTLDEQNNRQQNGHEPPSHFSHPNTARLHLHEPVHSPAGPATLSAQDREHSSQHFHNNNLTPNNHLTAVRESPMGQSSSNPDQTSGSNNSSQLSSYSISNKNVSTFKPQKVKPVNSMDPTLGPAAKYPELQKGNTTLIQTLIQPNNQRNNELFLDTKRTRSRQNLTSPDFISKSLTTGRQRNSATSDIIEFKIHENLTNPPSRFSSAFLDSDASSEEEDSLKPTDSIFDFPDVRSENGSVVPTSSRTATMRSVNSKPVNHTPKFSHKSLTSITPSEFNVSKTPDLLKPSSVMGVNVRTSRNQTSEAIVGPAEKKQRSLLSIPHKDNKSSHSGHDVVKGLTKKYSTNYARSRSLDDVRESGNESVLSFDVENTVLTVEPSDQSDMGTVRSYRSNNSVKAQLSRLEGMYTHVMKALDETTHGPRARRRWSIGSSDTSSLQHHTRQSRHSRMSAHGLGSKDVRAIGKRFQRLESHVITLARSVAHLSSELRSQNSLSREIENVKREMQELKSQGSALPASSGNFKRTNHLLTEFEKYQGWVPSLTNPRRVNKLTKFFGQEPPLLEIFLKQLGYEKFLKNFEEEHIGMIELPYMTEDKLQTIGIPMGPRLRILQEAQLQFSQGNFDIYFV